MNFLKKLYWYIVSPLKDAVVNEIVPYRSFRKNSYSQHGEDMMIIDCFQNVMNIKKPSYIDIGAHHPYEISNTAVFYEKGCRGINIEANPVLFQNFLRERPDDININCGLCSEDKTGEIMSFYMIDDHSPCNTFNKDLMDKFLAEHPEFSVKEIKSIKMKSISTVFDENGIDTFPDYMSIDIEGMEWDVLKDWDFMSDGPKIMTLEISLRHSHGKELKEKIESSGYFLWLKILSNYTFVRSEYKDLIYR